MRARTAWPAVSGGLALESDHTTANASGRPTTEASLSLPPAVVGIANASVTGIAQGVALGSTSLNMRPDSAQLSPFALHTCQLISTVPSGRVARPNESALSGSPWL